MDSSSVKQSVMKQVLAEANLANARVLIEVCLNSPPHLYLTKTTLCSQSWCIQAAGKLTK